MRYGANRDVVGAIVIAGVFAAPPVMAQAPASPPAPGKSAIIGAWTLNKDASDQPPARGDSGGREGSDGRGSGGGYGHGGGMGHGGYRGGMGRGTGGSQPPRANPEEMARMRDAMRDILTPADRLTIVQTDSMVVITGPDGRTTRLSPDGKKVKDDNTGIERKTRWDAGKLVSEINGAGRGKITQTYAGDAEHHQLRLTTQVEGGRSNQPRTITYVYDADAARPHAAAR
jgi:hypothetical protein